MSTETIKNKYRYDAAFQFVLDNESIDLDSKYIKSIIIDFDYKKNTMPLIYLTISMDNKIILKMLQNQDKGTIVFTIRRYISNNNYQNTIKTNYIKNNFIYFIADNLNIREANDDGQDLNSASGTNFVTTTIGLLPLDLVNINKKSLNCVINKTPMMSLIYNLLSDRSLVMEQLQYNTILDGIILPPLDSKAKLLKYLNNISCFYNTSYRYFMDFDTTYFLSSSGKKIPKIGEDISDIIINISRLDETDAKLEGMEIDYENKAYVLYIGDGFSEKIDNKLIERSYSTIVAQGTSLNTTQSANLNTNKDSVITKKRSTIRLPNDNTILLNNIKTDMDNSMTTIMVSKSDIDMSIFTINKRYYIKATDTYGDLYNGEYLLVRKREIYIREDDTFTGDVALTFNKLSNSTISIK